MNKIKKIVGIYLLIIGLIFIISGVLPDIISNIEFNKLEKEISLINNKLINETINKNDIKIINKNITIKNKKLEYKVEKYLNDVINLAVELLDIKKNNDLNELLSVNNLKNKDLIKVKEILENRKNNIEELEKNFEYLSKNDINNKEYKKLINEININNYKNIIDNYKKIIESYEKIISFLNEKNDYQISNNGIEFLKRNEFEEFDKFIKSINIDTINLSYNLKNDTDGPIIYAHDIYLYEGIGINLLNEISCIDEIDGKIDCNIIGNYDKNTIGVYPINISALDKSGFKTEKTINVNIVEREKLRYYVELIRNYNTVIVYELDENKEYTKIAKVFPCSTGRNGRTPTGIFYTTKGSTWGPLMGGVWGQYYTVITGNILFHSVPYYSMSKDNLEWEEYNKLGDFASAGCVRLSVEDAKWIYENCPNGMKIKIYDGELPAGVTKPIALKIDGTSPFRGWDPTDPDVNNPWHNTNN